MVDDLASSPNSQPEDLSARLRQLPLSPGEAEQAQQYVRGGERLAQALLDLGAARKVQGALAALVVAGTLASVAFAFVQNTNAPATAAASAMPAGLRVAAMDEPVMDEAGESPGLEEDSLPRWLF
jgi:hypothetical protein